MLFDFAPFEGRAMVAGFDGVAVTSDAGVLLRGAAAASQALLSGSTGEPAFPPRPGDLTRLATASTQHSA